MNWVVETLCTAVDKELEVLDSSLKAKFLHIAELLEKFGPANVGYPYVKPLGKKLWQIRMKGKTGIARAIYIAVKDKKIIVLHVFVKKIQKTPNSAIRIAFQRLKEIKS